MAAMRRRCRKKKKIAAPMRASKRMTPIAMPAPAPAESPPPLLVEELSDEAPATPASDSELPEVAVGDEPSLSVPVADDPAVDDGEPDLVAAAASDSACVVAEAYNDPTPPVLSIVNSGPDRKFATLLPSCSSNEHSIGYCDTVNSLLMGCNVYLPLSSSANQSAQCHSLFSMGDHLLNATLNDFVPPTPAP